MQRLLLAPHDWKDRTRSRANGTGLSFSISKFLDNCNSGWNPYGGIGLPTNGLIYIIRIVSITINSRKIIPIFLVLRTIVRIIAMITNEKTSPNVVTVIINASNFSFP